MDASWSVPFSWLPSGFKLAVLTPAICPAKSPQKQIASQMSKLPARFGVFGPAIHTMIEMSDSHVIKDSSIMIWPGKNAEASWEKSWIPNY